MNYNITSREDILLAKIAGRDVDLSTMTPPVASSVTEKLMLEVADRLDEIEDGGCGLFLVKIEAAGSNYVVKDGVTFDIIKERASKGDTILCILSNAAYYNLVFNLSVNNTSAIGYSLELDSSSNKLIFHKYQINQNNTISSSQTKFNLTRSSG